jgi:hypothetical protein
MRTKVLAAAAPFAAAIALAACGGGGGSSSSSTGASVAAFCQKGSEYQQLVRSFRGLSAGNLSALKGAIQQAVQKIREVDDVAPAAVKSSADDALSSLQKFNSVLQSANSPQDLRASASEITSSANAFQSAIGDLRSYGREHCQG